MRLLNTITLASAQDHPGWPNLIKNNFVTKQVRKNLPVGWLLLP